MKYGGDCQIHFQRFIETESYTAVADDLNTRKINPPAVYHKTGEVYCPPDAAYKDGIKVVWNALLKVTLTLESWYRERPALLQGMKITAFTSRKMTGW